jgi:hypothetical protein
MMLGPGVSVSYQGRPFLERIHMVMPKGAAFYRGWLVKEVVLASGMPDLAYSAELAEVNAGGVRCPQSSVYHLSTIYKITPTP